VMGSLGLGLGLNGLETAGLIPITGTQVYCGAVSFRI